MDKERSAIINIGGDEYELLLTTKATKEIAGRYGGLENLGDKLMKSENFEMAIGEIVWLITLLANQSILVHNLKNKENKRKLLLSNTNLKKVATVNKVTVNLIQKLLSTLSTRKLATNH